jgi:hypothetical protein
MVTARRTPHGVAFYRFTRPDRLWTFFVVWPKWWRVGITRALWTRAIALGPVAVALTDMRLEPISLPDGATL